MTDDWMKRPFQPSALPSDYFQRPSPARMWNYLQGGDDNFALDRATGDAFAGVFPEIFYIARHARRFLMRAVRHLARECDIGQFLDLGCGLPAPNDLRNVHEVAQAIRPDARAVYVDNDPVVISHADALLTSTTPEGRTAYIEADIHRPEPIIERAAQTLDLSKPTAVIMIGLLGHVEDYREARALVDTFMAAVPSGSFLVVDDGTDDSEQQQQGVRKRNETGIAPYCVRSPQQIRDYFHGLELIDPGAVPVSLWRPEPSELGTLRPVPSYAGVARKLGR